MAAAHARLIRDREQQSIAATDIVPGDILLLEEGDTIPADARLTQTTALQTAESALTGESLPVQKDTALITAEARLADRHNMVFSGTIVTYGRGRAVVVATGMQTEMECHVVSRCAARSVANRTRHVHRRFRAVPLSSLHAGSDRAFP